jgi:membrane peptidoglycan carboxypeptidase
VQIGAAVVRAMLASRVRYARLEWRVLGHRMATPLAAALRQARLRPRWALGGGAFLAIALLATELRTSFVEAELLAPVARGADFRVARDPTTPVLIQAPRGPYDTRLGYTELSAMIGRLEAEGFALDAHASSGDVLTGVRALGLFPPYREKTQAGLTLVGRAGRKLYRARFPERAYPSFDSIPRLLVRTLLFLEDREVLDAGRFRNPAVDWGRFGWALVHYLGGNLFGEDHVFGGSTLATQIEKFRHSPGGATPSGAEKLRQMASAALRAYREGPATVNARHAIIAAYLNTLPLGAARGYGEVTGIGDGLWAWFGRDFAATNRDLRSSATTGGRGTAHALAYRAALSLLLGQRHPSFYFGTAAGRAELDRLTDVALRRLTQHGVISPALAAAALPLPLAFRSQAPPVPVAASVPHKAANAMRAQLLDALGAPSLYALDHYDLTVRTTIDVTAQRAVVARLQQLHDTQYVRRAGLIAPNLLLQGDPRGVRYSVLLYERTPFGNAVRVQTDELDGPFDLNTGARLELGSTAKLRTLVTYLQIVEQLYRDRASTDAHDVARPAGIAALSAWVRGHQSLPVDDPITRWASDYLAAHPQDSLRTVLAAALERRYSASPRERFFTGGGTEVFANFDSLFDDSVLTVRTAFTQSVNLVFIRLMRDIVRYYVNRLPGVEADTAVPAARSFYLARFAERESARDLERLYREAVGPDGDTAKLEHAAPARAAALPTPLGAVDPLRTWLIRYLARDPHARWRTVRDASVVARLEAYDWLFRAGHGVQARALAIELEAEAFAAIGVSWQALGYPYGCLDPSLGTAIGSSGDRPEALAELVGILVNDGVRRPTVRFTEVHFAQGTPYEATLRPVPEQGDYVLSHAVAAIAHSALLDVVASGTGRGIWGVVRTTRGAPVLVGGKTGTGDNEYKTFGPDGRVLSARVVNRTAAFAFFFGDRFFGVVTAYVPGPRARGYAFTSALAVRALRLVVPDLAPVLRGGDATVPWSWATTSDLRVAHTSRVHAPGLAGASRYARPMRPMRPLVRQPRPPQPISAVVASETCDEAPMPTVWPAHARRHAPWPMGSPMDRVVTSIGVGWALLAWGSARPSRPNSWRTDGLNARTARSHRVRAARRTSYSEPGNCLPPFFFPWRPAYGLAAGTPASIPSRFDETECGFLQLARPAARPPGLTPTTGPVASSLCTAFAVVTGVIPLTQNGPGRRLGQGPAAPLRHRVQG